MDGSQDTDQIPREEYRRLSEVWDRGCYAEALRLLDHMVERSPSFPSLMGRGHARFLLGDLDGALSDFVEARHPKEPRRSQVRFAGVVLWVLGRNAAACADWAGEIARRRSREVTHTDAAGVNVPALLWWASAHSELKEWRRLAVEELRGRWRTKWCQASSWPGPIAAFLLGQVGEEELLARARALPARGWERVCQAHFYIGARALSVGEGDRYREQLGLAAQHGEGNRTKIEEYHSARFELDRMGVPSRTPPPGVGR